MKKKGFLPILLCLALLVSPIGLKSAYAAAAPSQAAPMASNVAMTGWFKVGATLTGRYTYSDADGDLEGASTFKWYRSDSSDGYNKAEIAGANAKTYVLTDADEGKYISFEVTPAAATGATPGTAVESASIGRVAAREDAPMLVLESPPGTPLVAHVFPAQAAGYNARNVPELTVTVKNIGSQPTGDLAITLSGGDPGAFSLSLTSLGSIVTEGTASFDVAVVGGYAPSTYNAAVTVSAAPGNANSIVPQSFTVQFAVNDLPAVAAPTFNPAEGAYAGSQNVTLNCATTDAQIRYTTDGTDPTANSAVYSAPISVTATTTIKAKAFKSGMNESAMARAVYTIQAPVPAPSGGSSFAIAGGGAYAGNQYTGAWNENVLTVQAECAKLVSVVVDGVQLIKDKDYTVQCGSTIVTLTPAYLAACKDGAHSARVQYTDGRYDGTFTTPLSNAIATAVIPDVPATGDTPWWAGLMALRGF